MIFKEHGVFKVSVEAKLLFIDATGPFNEESVKYYNKALESCIRQLEASPWNQIVSFHKMSMFTPEAENRLTETLVKRRSRGLIYCAVILADVDFKSSVKEQMSRCYHSAGVEHQYFDSMANAKEWINLSSSSLPLTNAQ